MPIPIIFALAPIAAMAAGKGAGHIARNIGNSRLAEAESIIQSADSFTATCQHQLKETRNTFLLDIFGYIKIVADISGKEHPDPVEIEKLPKRVRLFYEKVAQDLRDEPRSISFTRIMESAKSYSQSGGRSAVSLNRTGHPLLASLAGAVAGASEGFAYKSACEAYKSAAITAAEKATVRNRALLEGLTGEIDDDLSSFNDLISSISLHDNPSILWSFLLEYYDLIEKKFRTDDEQ
jgi:hypothetical protein